MSIDIFLKIIVHTQVLEKIYFVYNLSENCIFSCTDKMQEIVHLSNIIFYSMIYLYIYKN